MNNPVYQNFLKYELFCNSSNIGKLRELPKCANLKILSFSLQLGPSKALKFFQILNLIKSSVSIFGNKMDMANEVILASHGHRQIDPCQQGLILVKFARLTFPLNPSSYTWIKR